MLKIYEIIYELFISFSYIFSRFQELGPQNASRRGRLRPLSDAVELNGNSGRWIGLEFYRNLLNNQNEKW